MSTLHMPPRARDAAREGWVARRSSGEWTRYHRNDCALAILDPEPIRDVVRGPWRYLSAHWEPCPHCCPPVEAHRAA